MDMLQAVRGGDHMWKENVTILSRSFSAWSRGTGLCHLSLIVEFPERRKQFWL